MHQAVQWEIYKGWVYMAIMVGGGLDSVWTAALNSSKALQQFGVVGLDELGLSCVYLSKGEIIN